MSNKLLEDRMLAIGERASACCKDINIYFDSVSNVWTAAVNTIQVADDATFLEMVEAMEEALDL